MTKEEKENLKKNYEAECAEMLLRSNSFKNYIEVKQLLLDVVDIIDKIIELEEQENDD